MEGWNDREALEEERERERQKDIVRGGEETVKQADKEVKELGSENG